MSDQKKGNAGLLALGITAAAATAAAAFAAYQYFNDPHRTRENESHQYSRPPPLYQGPPRRPLTSDSSPDDDTAAETRQSRRAITPPCEQTIPTTPTTSNSDTHGDSRNPEEIPKCIICGGVMRINTIQLNCGHIFHDECLTIWRHVVVTQNPEKAKLCPTC